MKKFGFLVFILLVFVAKAQSQTNSVLSSGSWYKFAVTETGAYQLSGSDLENAGIAISNLDPAKLRLFGSAGGILPQANSALRPKDLVEMNMLVQGVEDGKLSSTDRLLFWAEGPDKVYFNNENSTFDYENNIYSDTSYYFLNIEQALGKRIKTTAPIIGSFPIVNTHFTYFVHEIDKINLLRSGRIWYGEKFDANTNQTFSTPLNNWVENSEIRIKSSVMAASFATSSFNISINDTEVGTQQLQSIINSRYAVKGNDNTQLFATTLPASGGSNLEVNYEYNKENGVGYLNYFLVQIEKNIILESSFLEITLPKKSTELSKIQAITPSSNTQLWNVANFNSVESIPIEITNNQLTANTKTDTTASLVIINIEADFATPEFIGQVKNQNLHGISNIDLLIITAPEFINQANELKEYKQTLGITSEVVLNNQVYNEFSTGRRDVTAIRDFAKYLYKNANLKHLLLFGKGTYDHKNYDEQNNSFVPIYESRNSLSPLYRGWAITY